MSPADDVARRASRASAPFGTVDRVPALPEGFADVFGSRRISARDVALHVVEGGPGEGAPVLLVPGWPQTWYAWRGVMLPLAATRRVIAVDPRGVGASDKPLGGYDTASLAADLASLMTVLGHERFDLVGHDVGTWISYALASDSPGRVRRLVMLEAAIPGIGPSPPAIGPDAVNAFVWHFSFNRQPHINELLVRGREEIYFGEQFRTKAAHPGAVPEYARAHYVDALRDSPEALRASFEFYRATEANLEQNAVRSRSKLSMPVLTVAGDSGMSNRFAVLMDLVVDDAQHVIVDDCGHYVPDEQPDALWRALAGFLDPVAPTAPGTSTVP